MNASTPLMAAILLSAALGAPGAQAQQQAGRDACVAQLRSVGGPDAQNGIEVVETQWSQAGTLVTMRDAGNTLWSCIGYDDGSVEDLRVVEAMDDGAGAMSGNTAREGPENEGGTSTVTVRFAKGTSGATYDEALPPGGSVRYVLGARDGQFLRVNVYPEGPGIFYQIFNPDGTFLLDMMDPETSYEGQLWQSGDHVVEVINRGSNKTLYRVDFGIR